MLVVWNSYIYARHHYVWSRLLLIRRHTLGRTIGNSRDCGVMAISGVMAIFTIRRHSSSPVVFLVYSWNGPLSALLTLLVQGIGDLPLILVPSIFLCTAKHSTDMSFQRMILVYPKKVKIRYLTMEERHCWSFWTIEILEFSKLCPGYAKHFSLAPHFRATIKIRHPVKSGRTLCIVF